jgi:serine/threonine protein kinase
MSSFFLLHCLKCGSDDNRPAKFCPKCGSPELVQVPLELAPDTTLDSRYRIKKLLTTGGMAQIYLADDQRLLRLVAVKRLLPDISLSEQQREAYHQQFRNEAYILAGLEHPGLPKVIDRFEEGGTEFHVLNFIDGFGLDNAYPTAAQPDVLRYVLVEALHILDYIHNRKIIHQDIKPDNFMVTKDNALFLIDFGIATKQADDLFKKPEVNLIFGSKLYSAPEQIEGRATSPASDLYSLGMTFAHLLIGLDRFLPSYEMRQTRNLITLDLTTIRDKSLSEVLIKATHWDESQRYQAAYQMREAVLSLSRQTMMLSVPQNIPATAATQVLQTEQERIDMLVLQLSHGASFYQRRMAARTLAEIDNPQVLTGLTQALEDSDIEVRQTAVQALTRRLCRPAVPKLWQRMQHETDMALKDGMRTAINFICQHHLPYIQDISAPDTSRWHASATVLLKDGETAIYFMLTTLQDTAHPQERFRSAQWFAALPGYSMLSDQRQHVFNTLVATYQNEPNAQLRAYMVTAVKNLAEKDSARVILLNWVNERDDNVLNIILDAIRTLADQSTLSALQNLAQYHTSQNIRTKTNNMLFDLIMQAGSNAVLNRLDATKLLAESRNPAALPRLVTSLKYDPDPRVQYFAAKGLAEFGNEEVIGALLFALDFKGLNAQHEADLKGVRYYAIIGLRRLGVVEAIPRLKKLRRRETDYNLNRLIEDTIEVLKALQ